MPTLLRLLQDALDEAEHLRSVLAQREFGRSAGDDMCAACGYKISAPCFVAGQRCPECGAVGRLDPSDEVERLRVLVYREARRHEEAGDGHECWTLLDQLFLKRRTPPPTEEERRSLGALAGCYTDPLPGPPLR